MDNRKITERVDAVTGMNPEQHSPTPPAPNAAKLELTAACNLRCSFCATSHGLRPKEKMSFEFYSEKLLPMLKKAGINEVGMFFLGESTILKDLPKFIAEAKRQGFPYIFLTTNGTAVTPEKIKSYMDAGLNSLKFSMNYADEDQFAEIAQVKPALYHKIFEAIKDAKRIRDEGDYDCGLYASYIDYTEKQGEEMMKVVKEAEPYLDEIYALPLYSQADLTGDDSVEKHWNVRAGNPGRAGNMREPIPCWSLFSELRVTWNGEVAGCCFAHDDRFNMGNLNDVDDFMDVWHSEKFQELRQAHLDDKIAGTACEGCAAWN